jgi:transcriptional regulator with XRE-family HTH domain
VIAIDEVIERSRLRRKLPEPAQRRMLRERVGLSQREIAEVVGVLPSAVSRWEGGSRTPSGESLDRYVGVLERLAAEVDS